MKIANPLTLQSLNAIQICARGACQSLQYRGPGFITTPLLTVAPVSPLESLFIRFNANTLSRSLKNDVDSGLFGKKNRARIASTTDGEPYISRHLQ